MPGRLHTHQSSNLQSSRYDPDTSTLTVQFVSGAIYQVPNFPASEYAALKQSGSPGTYWHLRIASRYNVVKLTGSERR